MRGFKLMSILFFSVINLVGQEMQIIAPSTTYVFDRKPYSLESSFLEKKNKNNLIPLQLPIGTTEYYIQFTTEIDELNAQKQKLGLNLVREVAKVATEGSSEVVFLAVDYLKAPYGKSNCNIYLFDNYPLAKRFMDGKKSQAISISKNIAQGTIKIRNKNHKERSVYMVIVNNTTKKCVMSYEAVAIVEEDGWTGNNKKLVTKSISDVLKKEPKISSKLNNQEIEILSGCFVSKLSNEKSVQEVANMNNYEISQKMNIMENCAEELNFTQRLNSSSSQLSVGGTGVTGQENTTNQVKLDKSYFIGLWADENSKIKFTEYGNCIINFDNGQREVCSWSIDGDILYIKYGKNENPNKIIEYSKNRFRYRSLVGDKKEYNAVRVR